MEIRGLPRRTKRLSLNAPNQTKSRVMGRTENFEGFSMRYLMKQKWLAFGDDYSIKTADGAEAFYVDGRAISIGDKLSMTDRSGREVAYIAQKIFAWGKTYEVYRDGR